MKSHSLLERIRRSRQLFWLLAVLLPLLSLALAGCGSSQKMGQRQLELAPVSRLPKKVASAPPVVREAYQFALANPDVLKFIPCYCGCRTGHGGDAHKSVKDCFVREVKQDGTVIWDDMGLG
jgi:hypothetical protein